MEGKLTFRVVNDLSELDTVAAKAQEFAEIKGLPRNITYLINLVLDEVITNVISYGYTDGGEHTIEVSLTMEAETVTIEIVDDGMPFSVPDAPRADMEQPWEDRRVGGLGCHLITKLMDEVSYRRADGKNHLVLRKSTKRSNCQLHPSSFNLD